MRIIDADKLKEMVGKSDCLSINLPGFVNIAIAGLGKLIDKQPTVDAVPVKRGRWINIASIHCDNLYRCSECKEMWLGIGGYNFCPNCGAKMDGERKDT